MIEANATVTEPSCNGSTNGSIILNASGGVTPFNYEWSNGAVVKDLYNIGAGSYILNYTDKNGCKGSSSYLLTQPSLLAMTKTIAGLRCFGDSTGNILVNVTGGTNPYNYSWSDGSTSASLMKKKAGTYVVTVTDAHGCYIKDTTRLTQPSPLYATLESPLQYSGYNITVASANDGSINLTINGGTSPYAYEWSNSSTEEDQYNLYAGNYHVTVTDQRGCVVTGDIVLTEPSGLEMPTGFSPNSDGRNDYFVIHGIRSYPDNKITVFNRWGNIVYEKSGYNNEWDGVNSNGISLPPATYFVLLEINGGEKVLKGYVDIRK
jgi:gliding motility-associated-like protein